MKQILTFVFLLTYTTSFGQKGKVEKLKIEIYLLKSFKPNYDKTLKLMGTFLASTADLGDTPFIKDNEILRYNIKRDTLNYKDSNLVDNRHIIEVSQDITERINNLKIPLCCGKQFALTVNGNIVYTGYFWNLVSSWGCDAITAFAYEKTIDIFKKMPDNDYRIGSIDLRLNPILLECLEKTNRLHK